MSYHSFALSTVAVLALAPGAGFAQQVIQDDLIVSGSLCVGIDCSNAEEFDFDTIRMKENNIRIQFVDTSTTDSFPGNDWRLIVNDAENGGRNMFALENTTAGHNPMTILATAPADALWVGTSGNIGLGTRSPVAAVHIVDGNSPALRLEQDGTAGFAAHAWDLGGNETGFFVRDVTDDGTLPLRVLAGSASDTLIVGPNGVGMGTSSIRASLDVAATDGSAQVLVRDTGGSGPSQMLVLENDGAPQIFMNNTTKNDAQWMFSAGRSMLLSPNDDPLGAVFELSNTGNLRIDGALTQSSDKRRKTAIEPVDPARILAKVAAMPVAEWTYIHDAEAGIRHIGPMAQDFYAAFGTGTDETGISALDGTGVALAAIQALAARNEALESEAAALQTDLRAMHARLETLETRGQ
ncbi:tail fiber domain-containing protein [Jannaschia sp.]|nr:tail fiber domain-containing protein [Jannaschia sp.]MDB2407692.1 tail fiber domain-containing protein [Jannaschia sp.]